MIQRIENAIASHQAWVICFNNAIKGINQDMCDVKTACDDSLCDLGKWLRTDANTLLKQTSYEQINTLHHSFHELAGHIAEKINLSETDESLQPLILEFGGMSGQLIKLLQKARNDLSA